MGVSKRGGLFLGKGRRAYVDEIFSSDLVQHVQQPVGHQVTDEVDGIRAHQHERDGDSPVQETKLVSSSQERHATPLLPLPHSPSSSPPAPPSLPDEQQQRGVHADGDEDDESFRRIVWQHAIELGRLMSPFRVSVEVVPGGHSRGLATA